MYRHMPSGTENYTRIHLRLIEKNEAGDLEQVYEALTGSRRDVGRSTKESRRAESQALCKPYPIRGRYIQCDT